MILFPMPAIDFHNRWRAIIVPENASGISKPIPETVLLKATENAVAAARTPISRNNTVWVNLAQMAVPENGDKRTYWRIAEVNRKTMKTKRSDGSFDNKNPHTARADK